jgi:hypothetical protein
MLDAILHALRWQYVYLVGAVLTALRVLHTTRTNGVTLADGRLLNVRYATAILLALVWPLHLFSLLVMRVVGLSRVVTFMRRRGVALNVQRDFDGMYTCTAKVDKKLEEPVTVASPDLEKGATP